MAIKRIIIVIKKTITVIMIMIIQILIMPIKKFKKTSYRPTLPIQVQRMKGTRSRDFHTLSLTLRTKGAIAFRVLAYQQQQATTFEYFLISMCYVQCQNILVNVLVLLLKPLSFRLRCPSFLLSKLISQIKLIQAVVQVGILKICVPSSIVRVLLSGFWVSGS